MVVEVTCEYELDIDSMVQTYTELFEHLGGDEADFVRELIESGWLQSHELGEPTYTNIVVV